jgi:O-antigen/teichoic acid export membrane protein
MKNIVKMVLEQYRDPLYRNSYYLMANTIVSSLLGVVFWVIAARFYDDADIGMAAPMMSASSIVISISSIGLGNSIIRFLSKHENKQHFVNTSITVISTLTIIVSVIFLLGINIWSPKLAFINSNWIFIASFIAFTAISAIFTLLGNIFVAYRDTKYSLIQNCTVSALKIPLPILLAPIFGVFGVFGSLGIALTIATIVSIFFFIPRVQPGYFPYPTIKIPILKEIFSFSLANYITSIIGSLPGMIMPLLVLNKLSAEESAYFFAASAMASIINIVPSALSISLFAEGSFDEGRFLHNFKRALKTAYAIVIPGVILAFIIGDDILSLFKPSYAIGGYGALCTLAIAGLLSIIPSFYGTYMRIRMRMREMQILSIINSTATISLSYWLVPKLGIEGVGWSYIVVYAGNTIYQLIRLYMDFKAQKPILEG